MADFLILGAGFTARRVAQRLIATGATVTVTNRQPIEIAGARSLALDITNSQSVSRLRPWLSDRTVILHSIPLNAGTPQLVEQLRHVPPARIVYLSTTGVYGAAQVVDEFTPPDPETDKDRARILTEQTLADGPWTTMVLRPAAIYGPGRGIHWSARQDPPRSPAGNRLVSRIHVDDLAEHALRALQTFATGAFPVADEEPSPSSEVARWTFEYLGLPFARGESEAPASGRRVDGTAVRTLLGIRLRYPTFREGIAACLTEERANAISPSATHR